MNQQIKFNFKEEKRSRRFKRLGRRAKTLALKNICQKDIFMSRLDVSEREVLSNQIERPKTRGECKNGLRPCPWVSCKYHLFLDINPKTGSIKFNFPDKDLCDLHQTCALDVADSGGATLEDVGVFMNNTRERIRQVELSAIKKIRNTESKETKLLAEYSK